MPPAKIAAKRSVKPHLKSNSGFRAVFAALQKILKPYEKHFNVVPYKPEFYCLETRLPCHKGKPAWFAAIRMGKNYVSFHSCRCT